MRNVVAAAALTFAIAGCRASAPTSCADLKALSLGDASITQSASVPAGPFAVPADPGAAEQTIPLPAFCRVQGVIAPTKDSHIEFEVWLPDAGWNGKYQGVGNGAFAGAIEYSNDLGGLASALRTGYAAASTDTGHKGAGIDAGWALGHPEKVIDYGYRAIHETAEKSKAIIRAFYGEPAKHSYFSSCSTGGRQALMEAQRFPADYDGIIAGAPAANFTRILAAYIWNLHATRIDPASYIPIEKFAAIEAAAVAACDARDGLKDGIVNEPIRCEFDPTVLLCKGRDSDACLTAPQVAAVEKIYSGPRTRKGEQIYPGLERGGEAGWAGWVAGPTPEESAQFVFGTQALANLVFQNATYDYKAFDIDGDTKAADDRVGGTLNAINADLSTFERRGGKLILYHGWSDPALPPTGTIDYYGRAAAWLGNTGTEDTLRLYMVPGMEHCGGGPGANNFGATPGMVPAEPDPTRNMTAALERWVERGTAPSVIVATKYNTEDDPASGVEFTRPLCPYPQVARYKGSGSQNDASNFNCAAP
jgi:hypothetical protein